MPEQGAWERAARQINEATSTLAPMMAAGMEPGPNMVKASSAKERADYWQRNPDVDEQQLWAEAIQEGVMEGLDPQGAIERATPRVAMMVYPARAVLLNQGERKRGVPGWVNKQIDYAKRMERLGPPDTEGGDEYGP